MGRIIYKTDPFLVELGCQGADAYAKDEYGNFIIEAVRRPSDRMLRLFLELMLPKKYGKHRKRAVPHKSHVLVVGKITKKPEYNTAASVKARNWKSLSRKIREAKAEFPWEFSNGRVPLPKTMNPEK